jgi:hypothetical protein
MPIVAASAMNVNNSTVTGNIQAIKNLLMQGGVCDPAEVEDDKSPDVSEYIMLVHRDLGTGKHIASLQQHQSIEKTCHIHISTLLIRTSGPQIRSDPIHRSISISVSILSPLPIHIQ